MQDAPEDAVTVVIRKALENFGRDRAQVLSRSGRDGRNQQAQAAEVVPRFSGRQLIQAVRDFGWLHVN